MQKLEVNVCEDTTPPLSCHKHSLTPLALCVHTLFDFLVFVLSFLQQRSCLSVDVYVPVCVCIRCSVYAQYV